MSYEIVEAKRAFFLALSEFLQKYAALGSEDVKDLHTPEDLDSLILLTALQLEMEVKSCEAVAAIGVTVEEIVKMTADTIRLTKYLGSGKALDA